MCREVRALVEAVLTLTTLVGSFSCVDLRVLNEGRAVRKSFPTLGVLRSLTCVHLLMPDQV